MLKVRQFNYIIHAVLTAWKNPYKSFLGALLVYILIAVWKNPSLKVTEVAYFNYLADALLHKQLNLRLIPLSTHDLVFFNGKYFLYWPPFPAILLMPFIAIFGIGFSDVIFTVILAAVNVGLIAHLLQVAKKAKIIFISEFQHTLLVLFFAFGTVHFTLAPYGRVWFLGQVIAFLFSTLTYIAAISFSGWRAFFFTGLALAAAMMTRNHLFLVGIWPAYYLITQKKDSKKNLRNMLIGIAPLILAGVLLASYNWARFGNITELGLDYHQMATFFRDDYKSYGAFNIHYVPINFYYQYIYYPFPPRAYFGMGGSLFLLSPVFFSIGWLFFKKTWGVSKSMLALSILAVSIPVFFLMGTGWVQFGPRYTLDFTVPLLLLTAQGIKFWSDRWLSMAVFVSVLHYLIGTFAEGLFFL